VVWRAEGANASEVNKLGEQNKVFVFLRGQQNKVFVFLRGEQNKVFVFLRGEQNKVFVFFLRGEQNKVFVLFTKLGFTSRSLNACHARALEGVAKSQSPLRHLGVDFCRPLHRAVPNRATPSSSLAWCGVSQNYICIRL